MSKNMKFQVISREHIINRIIHLIDILGIKHLYGWDCINFVKTTSIRDNKELKTEELVILLEDLERILEERGFDESAIYLNPGYTDGSGKEIKEVTDYDKLHENIEIKNNEAEEIVENWRGFIPNSIKKMVPWETISLELINFCAKELLQYSEGQKKKEIKSFIEKLEYLQASTNNKNRYISLEKDAYPLEDWRNNIPAMVKCHVQDWETYTMDDLTLKLRDLVYDATGLAKTLFEDYLCELEDLQLELEDSEKDEGDDTFLFDPLKVIAKYQDGSYKEKDKEKEQSLPDESWRNIIPSILKFQITDWKKAPILEVYNKAKEILWTSSGTKRKIILEFVSEMSQIIYEQVDSENEIEEGSVDSSDDIADSILSLVEMIILPRLEVMDKIQTSSGKVSFANLWDKPFSESLKNKVKERDKWKCVICESETELHVHHKIPRNLGGIHHIDNLVTLCASCHAAIETADINHAFTKCFANYKRKKFTKNKVYEEISKDKKLLKEEVEDKLDKILVELNNKDELKLMEEVMGVMRRLEIIFYD